MSSKDDPGRDPSRPADVGGQPKKPYATIELKATEVPPKADAGAPKAAETARPTEAGKPAAGSAVPGVKPASAAATSTEPAGGKADAAKPKPEDRKLEDRKPAAAVAAPEAAAPRRSGFGSFLSHMVAAVLGGGIVLFGAEQIVKTIGLPAELLPGQQETAGLQQRIAALESQGRITQGQAPSAELARRLTDGESRLARLEEQAKGLAGLSAATQALQERVGQGAPAETLQRVARLEETLESLAAAGQGEQAGRLPQLAALNARIRELETAISSQTTALRRDLTQALETRTQQVAEAGEVARSATQRIDRDMSAVKTEGATLTQRVEALKADIDRAAQTLRVVQEETGAVRSAVDGLKGDVDNKLKSVARPTDVTAAMTPLTAKLAELEQGLQGVVRSEADRRSNAERIVLSLELANLKRVLDRGQRYEAELAEVKKAAGGRLDLAALEAHKAQGVLTAGELQRDFRPVSRAILDADSEPVDGGVVDRLLAGAKSIVRVRKVDPGSSDKSAEAVVARMEAALRDGRLGHVLDEAKQLQPRSQDAAKDWLAKVEARHSVDRALAAVEGQLKSSLGGGSRQN